MTPATAWLKANPAVLEAWLAGVSSRDGQDGLEAASALLAPEGGGFGPAEYLAGTA